MKKGLTEIIFVLDESGSMSMAKTDTIGGFNEFVEGQKRIPGEAKMTLVKFSTYYNIVYDGVLLPFVKNLDLETYTPGGGTALLDAIGKAIDTVGSRLSETEESERPEKVMFIVLTDGEENSSRTYSHQKISDMVKHQTDTYKWEFVFMGANIDAFSNAQSINITNSVNTTYGDMKRSMKAASYYTANSRVGSSNFSMDNFNLTEKDIDKKMADLSQK
jgi:uncharacterized protein YegL